MVKPTATSATLELDKLMASLSDFRVQSNPSLSLPLPSLPLSLSPSLSIPIPGSISPFSPLRPPLSLPSLSLSLSEAGGGGAAVWGGPVCRPAAIRPPQSPDSDPGRPLLFAVGQCSPAEGSGAFRKIVTVLSSGPPRGGEGGGEGGGGRWIGPLLLQKSDSQDRLISELQGRLGIPAPHPTRSREAAGDWLTWGEVVSSQPIRSREQCDPGLLPPRQESRVVWDPLEQQIQAPQNLNTTPTHPSSYRSPSPSPSLSPSPSPSHYPSLSPARLGLSFSSHKTTPTSSKPHPQAPPTFTQAPPTSTQNHLSLTQAPPTFTQAPPTSTQNHLSLTQAPPTFTQAPPTSTQNHRSLSQAPPTFTQAPPTFTQAPPSFREAPPMSFQPTPPYTEHIHILKPPTHTETPPSPLRQAPPPALSFSDVGCQADLCDAPWDWQYKPPPPVAQPVVTSSRPAAPPPQTSGSLDSMLGLLQSDLSRQGIATTAKGTCAACQKPIVSQVVTALGQTWHQEHFVCSHCQKEIGGSNFFEKDGLPFCESDYFSLFSPRCGLCSQPILDKMVTALDKNWHPEHFCCVKCGRPFGEEGFHERDGRQYCQQDFFSMFASRCHGCSKPIQENYISALNVLWHPECFVCRECYTPFVNGSFFEHEGQPLCETHYHRSRGSLCSSCERPITGRCITAMGAKFHPEHFVCAFCLKQLNKGTFKEQGEKPYCHPCFIKLFG
ncbi:transforming growth factor beta-1-induced transcript 1 protein-like isoform X1 [Acipenser ruthenus]|uniref:transforming growth factor beta-1-induced transcript 1 protein-like isoform X1 n=1 Tax=Acipenser ruthenus TaxID=7906 RepID=UPI00274073F8|nr:transforming growth factor beta-1-induced transcript 1 protein-like isoform X1 [Acipenser ruthenus]